MRPFGREPQLLNDIMDRLSESAAPLE